MSTRSSISPTTARPLRGDVEATLSADGFIALRLGQSLGYAYPLACGVTPSSGLRLCSLDNIVDILSPLEKRCCGKQLVIMREVLKIEDADGGTEG